MAYNWKLGDAPTPVPTPTPAFAPARRPVGGRPVKNGARVRTADGRMVASRPPGTQLYVPGYLDDESDALILRQQQLGLAIPVAPVLSLLSSKGPDKKKWRERTNRLNEMTAKAEAGDASALAELDKMAGGYGGAWGTAYNPIKRMARDAAARIRAKQAGAAPAPGSPPIVVQPVPGVIPIAQPIPAPPPTYSAPVPVPASDSPPMPATPDAPIAPGAPQSGGGFDAGKLVVPGLVVAGLLMFSGGFRRGRR